METSKQIYSYDIILMKSNYPQKSEENLLVYSVRLFDEFVVLPERRLLTKRFPRSPLGELETTPCEIIKTLNEKGVCVTLYENEGLLGCGVVKLSAELLKKLAEPTFKAKEVIDVPLLAGKKTIATVQLHIKISCVDPNLDTRLVPFGCYDVCRPLDKSVDPRDMMLTLGRSATGAVASCITDKRLMSHPGPAFSCVRAQGGAPGKKCACPLRGIEPHPEIDPSKDRERKLLKKLLIDLDIDRVHVPTPPSEFAKSKLCRCPMAENSDHSSLSLLENWSEADESKGSGSLQALSSGIGLTTRQQQELNNIRRRSLALSPQVETPKLNTNKYKPPLICPVCKANITWLPKVAACPYCGYKRYDLENPSEEVFDETATASEVLRNHLLNTRLNNTEEQQQKEGRCMAGGDRSPPGLGKECSCKLDRICTRCRIRELCEQMFTMSSKTKLQTPLPTPAETQAKANPEESQEMPEPNREKLVKILTELHKKYGGKKSKNDSSNDSLPMECEEECNKASKNKQKRRRTSKAFKEVMQELDQRYPVNKIKISPKPIRRPRSKRYTFIERREDVLPKSTHKSCARNNDRVPCHMGWRWNESELARHRSWKPGAITKPIRELMAYFLKDYPVDCVNPSRFHCRRQRKLPEPVPEEPLIQQPTLQITRKHDEYVITLRPLKDPETLAKAANPYANMKPVVFRITKDPIATGIRNMKISLKDKEYPVCTCHMPIAECFCRSLVDKRIVEEEVRNMCTERGWNDLTDTFIYSDLSESDSEKEFDFGVTPPAGVIKPERSRKPDRVNCETQYNENDWAMPTMFPHPPNAQVQYGGCVVGERKKRFDWIFGKGFVHREPKPPKKRNMPKKIEKTGKQRQKGGCDVGDNSKSQISFSHALPVRRPWHKSNRDIPLHYSIGPVR